MDGIVQNGIPGRDQVDPFNRRVTLYGSELVKKAL
jgi:hypothetical protein